MPPLERFLAMNDPKKFYAVELLRGMCVSGSPPKPAQHVGDLN